MLALDDFIVFRLKVMSKLIRISLRIYRKSRINGERFLSIYSVGFYFTSRSSLFIINKTKIILPKSEIVTIFDFITNNWSIFFSDKDRTIYFISIPIFISYFYFDFIGSDFLIFIFHRIELVNSWSWAISKIPFIAYNWCWICITFENKSNIGFPNGRFWTNNQFWSKRRFYINFFDNFFSFPIVIWYFKGY